jgi:plastocyanin
LFSAGGSRSRRTRLVAGIFGIALVLAACGGDDGGNGEPTGATGETNGSTGATSETGAGGASEIFIQGFRFQPGTLEVSGPTEVTITNNDMVPHTFTLDDESIDESLDGGASVTVTLDLSESTGYFCRIHPDMTGVIEVV